MRRAVTPAVPPSMYRHFAIVTLVLTTGLAMFAEGEGREAQAVRAPSTAPAPATFANADEAAEHASGGWDDGGDPWGGDLGGGSFGAVAGSVFAGSDSSTPPDWEDIAAPGYSAEYLQVLSEAERTLLLQGLQDNGMLSPEIRRRRSAALREASSRRSGAPVGEV